MSDVRIDKDGDLWEARDNGWVAADFPSNWLPDLETLDRVFGPLTDPYEED